VSSVYVGVYSLTNEAMFETIEHKTSGHLTYQELVTWLTNEPFFSRHQPQVLAREIIETAASSSSEDSQSTVVEERGISKKQFCEYLKHLGLPRSALELARKSLSKTHNLKSKLVCMLV